MMCEAEGLKFIRKSKVSDIKINVLEKGISYLPPQILIYWWLFLVERPSIV